MNINPATTNNTNFKSLIVDKKTLKNLNYMSKDLFLRSNPAIKEAAERGNVILQKGCKKVGEKNYNGGVVKGLAISSIIAAGTYLLLHSIPVYGPLLGGVIGSILAFGYFTIDRMDATYGEPIYNTHAIIESGNKRESFSVQDLFELNQKIQNFNDKQTERISYHSSKELNRSDVMDVLRNKIKDFNPEEMAEFIKKLADKQESNSNNFINKFIE